MTQNLIITALIIVACEYSHHLGSDERRLYFLGLKGQCHGDFAPFGQNFAEIEIKCLHSHTKSSWYIKREISSEFLQGEQTIISFQ